MAKTDVMKEIEGLERARSDYKRENLIKEVWRMVTEMGERLGRPPEKITTTICSHCQKKAPITGEVIFKGINAYLVECPNCEPVWVLELRSQ